MAEVNGTNGVPSLEENAFPALESAPEKPIEGAPTVSSSNGVGTPEASKELSHADKLMQQHMLAAQSNETETKTEEPEASELAVAPASEKRARKHKAEDPAPAAPPLDVSSAEAFPSLGGPAKVVPAVSPMSWGAKMATPRVNGSNGSSEANARAPAPAFLGSAGQLRVELSPAQKRPLSELRKPLAEVVKEIMKKTNTKVEMSQTSSKTAVSVYIITGTEVNRQRARREIFKELSIKVI